MNEEALEVLRHILENSRLAITVVDNSGQLTIFNKAAEKLTGYRREEVLGRPVSMFYASQEELAEMLGEVEKHGKVEDYETRLVGKDGNPIPISIIITVLQDVLGRTMGTLGISVDLTERKKLELELREAKKKADFFTDLLCHDIRNFDQTILGYLELLLNGTMGELSQEQLQVIAVCRRQAKRVAALIDRVQMLSRMEEQTGIVTEKVEVNPVVQAAVEAVLESYPERKITMEHLPHPDAWVEAGPLFFEAVFNLINNAVAHNSSASPKVRLIVNKGVSGSTPVWRICVEDNGPGLPFDDKQDLFDRFAQRRTSGSGVGLSLVKAFVDGCKGRVWMEDRIENCPAKGIRVVMELPEAEREPDGLCECES